MKANSKVKVEACIFKTNENVGGGSVVFSTGQNAQLTLIDNIFEEHKTNFSLIRIEEGSILKIESSIFRDNVVSSSGKYIKFKLNSNKKQQEA